MTLDLQLTNDNYPNFSGEAVLVFTQPNQTDALLSQYEQLTNFKPELGKICHLYLPKGLACQQLIMVSLGKDKPSEQSYQTALLAGLKLVNQSSIKTLWVAGYEDGDGQNLQNTATTIANSLYQYNQPDKPNQDQKTPLEQVFIYSLLEDNGQLKQGLAIAQGMALSRALSDLPSNICTPSYLATTAVTLSQEYQLTCDILDTKQMNELGMNSLLSVSKGSDEDPKFIILHYQGAGDETPIVLIGKGVTFDSGGISLKPGSNMDEMKYDMCGGASVLGTMKSIAQMALPINLTVIVPSVENMPSARASKPGDVVTSLSGQTIEILNTDAEGRLILCDAITYAKRFNPKTIIDVATLTGAIIIALGREYTGLMSNRQSLADGLTTAGNQTLDTVWQLPINEQYDALLKSNFADMANIGNREAGSITAACFLARFAKDINWAHLDIAGTAWNTGNNKGATGRPVSLLCQYLMNLCLETSSG